MSDDLVKVTVSEGKYTFGQRKDGSCYALRYGETWREDIFDGLTLAMAYRIEELNWLQRCNELAGDKINLRSEVMGLEAKLSKAKEFIADIEAGPSWGESLPSWLNTRMLEARTTLAELNKERSDEKGNNQ